MNETLPDSPRLLKTYEHLHWIRGLSHKRIIEVFAVHFAKNQTVLEDILEREERREPSALRHRKTNGKYATI